MNNTEGLEREIFRIMENIRKTTTDTKGAVFVVCRLAGLIFEKMVNQDVIMLNKRMDDLRKDVAKLEVEKGDT